MTRLSHACLIALALSIAAPAHAGDFRWKVPFKATVTETTVKDGKRAKTRYRVTVTPDAKSGKLLVDHKRFKFLELEGLDMKSPVTKALVKKLERRAASAIPGMLIDPASGKFKGIVGLDRMVRQLSKAGLLKPAELDQFKKMMKMPAIQDAIRREVSQVWLCWAGIWAGATPSVATPEFRNITLDVVGRPFPFFVQLKGGPTAKDSGKLQYSFVAKLKAKTTKNQIKAFRKTLKLVTGGRRGPNLTAVSKRLSCKVTLDAKTYQPLRVVRADVTTLHEKGKDGKTTKTAIKESHTYTFKW